MKNLNFFSIDLKNIFGIYMLAELLRENFPLNKEAQKCKTV
jgi:hypothetical protein